MVKMHLDVLQIIFVHAPALGRDLAVRISLGFLKPNGHLRTQNCLRLPRSASVGWYHEVNRKSNSYLAKASFMPVQAKNQSLSNS
jgi:hypothetical protein